MFGVMGENSPVCKKVFVYSNTTPLIFYHEFISCTEAAKHFYCGLSTISKHLNKNKLFKTQWLLFSSKQN